MRKFEGIIFDMDGVIFDTERLGLESWIIVGERYGFDNVEETCRKCTGRNTADSMEIIRQDFGDKIDIESLHGQVKEVFHSLIMERGLPIKPYAKEILSHLWNDGVKVGLASSTEYSTVENQLRSAGLFGYFDAIVGGNMVKHSKPEPEIYLLACEKLGVNPENTYAVEDSYNGIRSAFNAKMHPIMIPDLLKPDDEMKEKSECIFDNLSQFEKFLYEE